jgi:hypothetical protein
VYFLHLVLDTIDPRLGDCRVEGKVGVLEMQPQVVRYVDCDIQMFQIPETAILQGRIVFILISKVPRVVQVNPGDCVPLGRQESLDPCCLGRTARDLERVGAVCESSRFDVDLSADLLKVECQMYLFVDLSQDWVCSHSRDTAPPCGRAVID